MTGKLIEKVRFFDFAVLIESSYGSGFREGDKLVKLQTIDLGN